MDDELEVLSVGEEGTTLRKKKNATEKWVNEIFWLGGRLGAWPS